MTYFEVFGLPPRLTIDLSTLERSFFRLSRELHPDRARPEEQDAANERASLLNDAYRTLRDPIRRTRYALELDGVELEEQSVRATAAARSSGAQKQQIVPPDLLEEAFELNMQLEELKDARAGGGDDAGVRREVEQIRAGLRLRMDNLQDDLQQLWTEYDAALEAADEAAVTKARQGMVDLLNRRSYLRNLLADIESVLTGEDFVR